MRLRVIVGFALLVLLICVLYVAPTEVLVVAISLLSVLSVQELLGATGFVRKKRIVVYALVMAAAVPPWYYFDSPPWLALLGVFLMVFLLFIEGLIEPANITFEMISAIFLTATVLPFFFSCIFAIATMPLSRYISILPFIAAFGSDTVAFLVGRKLGKRKLAPLISPHKTVEGGVGGMIGTTALMLIYGVIMQFGFGLHVNYFFLALYGVLGAAAALIGDLSMSFVKREFGIKDFGTLLPGHGGVLDRFDSFLFAAPLIELLLLCCPAIR